MDLSLQDDALQFLNAEAGECLDSNDPVGETEPVQEAGLDSSAPITTVGLSMDAKTEEPAGPEVFLQEQATEPAHPQGSTPDVHNAAPTTLTEHSEHPQPVTSLHTLLIAPAGRLQQTAAEDDQSKDHIAEAVQHLPRPDQTLSLLHVDTNPTLHVQSDALGVQPAASSSMEFQTPHTTSLQSAVPTPFPAALPAPIPTHAVDALPAPPLPPALVCGPLVASDAMPTSSAIPIPISTAIPLPISTDLLPPISSVIPQPIPAEDVLQVQHPISSVIPQPIPAEGVVQVQQLTDGDGGATAGVQTLTVQPATVEASMHLEIVPVKPVQHAEVPSLEALPAEASLLHAFPMEGAAVAQTVQAAPLSSQPATIMGQPVMDSHAPSVPDAAHLSFAHQLALGLSEPSTSNPSVNVGDDEQDDQPLKQLQSRLESLEKLQQQLMEHGKLMQQGASIMHDGLASPSSEGLTGDTGKKKRKPHKPGDPNQPPQERAKRGKYREKPKWQVAHRQVVKGIAVIPPPVKNEATWKEYKDRIGTPEEFDMRIREFYRENQATFIIPKYDKVHMDLFFLFTAVAERGGYESVTVNRQWRQIGLSWRPELSRMKTASHVMRFLYVKHLLAFENHLTENCPGRVIRITQQKRKAILPGEEIPSASEGLDGDGTSMNGDGESAPASKRPRKQKSAEGEEGSGAKRSRKKKEENGEKGVSTPRGRPRKDQLAAPMSQIQAQAPAMMPVLQALGVVQPGMQVVATMPVQMVQQGVGQLTGLANAHGGMAAAMGQIQVQPAQLTQGGHVTHGALPVTLTRGGTMEVMPGGAIKLAVGPGGAHQMQLDGMAAQVEVVPMDMSVQAGALQLQQQQPNPQQLHHMSLGFQQNAAPGMHTMVSQPMVQLIHHVDLPQGMAQTVSQPLVQTQPAVQLVHVGQQPNMGGVMHADMGQAAGQHQVQMQAQMQQPDMTHLTSLSSVSQPLQLVHHLPHASLPLDGMLLQQQAASQGLSAPQLVISQIPQPLMANVEAAPGTMGLQQVPHPDLNAPKIEQMPLEGVPPMQVEMNMEQADRSGTYFSDLMADPA